MEPEDRSGERPRADVRVSFRLMGDQLDPDAITQRTGIEPDTAHWRGDARPQRKGLPYPPWRSGMWSIASEDDESIQLTVEEHLVRLLDQLDPVRPELLSLAAEQELECDFFCGYFMHTINSGWQLTPETLGRIAALGAELGFDVYGP